MGRIIDGIEVLLHIELFIFMILFQMRQCTHPSLLDELIIAGELPSHEFLSIPRREIEILIEKGSSDILTLQHVLGLELDGEVGGRRL